eukprot:915249-Rhodomonas_salina.3
MLPRVVRATYGRRTSHYGQGAREGPECEMRRPEGIWMSARPAMSLGNPAGERPSGATIYKETRGRTVKGRELTPGMR